MPLPVTIQTSCIGNPVATGSLLALLQATSIYADFFIASFMISEALSEASCKDFVERCA